MTISLTDLLLRYLCIYLPISLSFYLSVYLCIYLPFYLSVYLSIYVSLYLSIYLSIYLSTYLPTYLSIYLSIYLTLPYLTLSYLILSYLILSYRSSYIAIFLSIHRFCPAPSRNPRPAKVVQNTRDFHVLTRTYAWRHCDVPFFDYFSTPAWLRENVLRATAACNFSCLS